MFINFKRILMAEVDAGGASGGAAPAAPAPATPAAAPSATVPQAQGAAPAMTKELSDAVASEIAKILPGLKDSIFAEARRTFTEKRNPKPADGAAPTAPASPQALDPSDERRMLRGFDRSLAQLKLADSISPSQYERAERALLAERPDDVSAWAKDYFHGFGSAAQPASPASPQPSVSAPAAPKQPAGDQPLSSRGAPPAPQIALEEIDLPTATDADRQAFIAKKGMKAYVDTLQKQLRGRRVSAA